MKKSESIVNLTKGLAKFHSQVEKIKKDAKNPFFKSNYASLPHILNEIAEPMEKAGLVISQFPDGDALTTMLIHAESGEFISSSYTLQMVRQNDPQAHGSAISYARRYALSSILSLQIDDDDAEKATAPVRKQEPDQPQKPWLNKNTESWKNCVHALNNGYTMVDIKAKYSISKTNEQALMEEASNQI